MQYDPITKKLTFTKTDKNRIDTVSSMILSCGELKDCKSRADTLAASLKAFFLELDSRNSSKTSVEVSKPDGSPVGE